MFYLPDQLTLSFPKVQGLTSQRRIHNTKLLVEVFDDPAAEPHQLPPNTSADPEAQHDSQVLREQNVPLTGDLIGRESHWD